MSRTHHGGWIETAAKLCSVALIIGVVVLKLAAWRADLPPEASVSPVQRAAILAEAQKVHDDFIGRDRWTIAEAIIARNRLVELEVQLFSTDETGIRQIGQLRNSVVDRTIQERQAAVRAAARHGTIAQQRAQWDLDELGRAYMFSLPSMVKQADGRLASLGWLLAGLVVGAYLLFVPFALVIFVARLRRLRYAVADEFVYGWRNLLFSALLWPFGLEDYPRDTAQEFRRRRIEAEYRARVGKTMWNDHTLTAADWRCIEELVAAPKAELAARLAAIRDMPATLLWQARLAAYTGMIIGFLTASVSLSAQAQSHPSAEVAATTEAEERPPFEVHGFTLIELGVPDRPLTVARSWINGEAHPRPDTDIRLDVDLLGTEGVPVLVNAFMRYTPEGTPFSLRAGQMANRAVFMLPELYQERLIGGPGAAVLMSFQDLGIEVAGQHGKFGWAFEVMSGAGRNQPDNNDDKDVMASLALGPFGPLRFALAFQAGQQPDGFRARSAVHAVGAFGPLTVDLLGTHQFAVGEHSWAASGMIGWRIHKYLDIAAGYDEMRVADSPDDHLLRAQLTLHLLDDHAELAATYRWSDVEGHALLSRLQFSF